MNGLSRKLIRVGQVIVFLKLSIMLAFTFLERIDYTSFNAIENNMPLKDYPKYSSGIKLYEAPYGVDLDLKLKHPKTLFEGNNYAAYYYETGKFIKIDEGKYYTLPHELGHHFWSTNLTKNDRMKFCSNTNYENWSYDNTCSEGFAELFGAVITTEKGLELNWKLEEGMFYIENKRIFSKKLENTKRMEELVEAFR